MDKDRCRDLIKLALQQREFPPRLRLPEASGDSVAALFSNPYVVWVPESLRPNRRPACSDPSCLCSPGIKEYKCRAVDDVDHVTYFLYVKYCCTGARSTRTTFSTKSGKYLSQASDSVHLQLPYILQKKGGKSKTLFQLIHDGIMSADGLERVRVAVERARHTRYYFLRSLFAARVQEKIRGGKLALAPTAMAIEDYMKLNPVQCHQALTQFWMDQTLLLSVLASHVMRRLEIKRVLRVDHSRKLAKKLRKHTTTTRQDQKEMHLLLLMQNEAGQIVARAFTRSENNEETKRVLEEEIKSRIPTAESVGEQEPVYLVTDNANALRGMVQSVFGPAVSVKQDPFHVFQRLTEKISDRGTRKLFSKALRGALYDGDDELKPAEVAAAEVEAVCAKFVPVDRARSVLKCSVAEWEGSVRSNIAQITAGDLYVASNVYTEGAGSSKIVATSQLESVHAQLKRLINRAVSYEVGLRVLDIYLLEHNLKAGVKFWRNPQLGSLDLLTLCRAAACCNGILPESEQLEYALSACAAQMLPPKYHYATKHDYPHASFNALFRHVKPNAEALEARLHPQHEYRQDVRRLLLSHVSDDGVDQSLFAVSLRSFTASTEDASPLSHHEYEMLRQVRLDQLTHGNSAWSKCTFTTTLLYNIAATWGENSRFKLRQRSIDTLRKHIKYVDARLESNRERIAEPLFHYQSKPIHDGDDNEYESLLQAELFTILRSMESKRSVIELFCRLYDVAASLLDKVRPKPEKLLRKRWEAVRKVDKRSSKSTLIRIPISIVESALPQADAIGAVIEKDTTNISKSASTNEFDCTSTTIEGVPTVGRFAAETEGSECREAPQSDRSEDIVGGEEDLGPVVPPSSFCAPDLDLDDLLTTTRVPPQTFAMSSEAAIAAPPSSEFVSRSDLEEMRLMSERMGKNVRGKWHAIARWYAGVNPESALSVDALYCRVKRHKRQRDEILDRASEAKKSRTDSTLLNTALVPAQGKKRSACPSCRKKHRPCGGDSKNPDCALRLAGRRPQTSLATFFST